MKLVVEHNDNCNSTYDNIYLFICYGMNDELCHYILNISKLCCLDVLPGGPIFTIIMDIK